MSTQRGLPRDTAADVHGLLEETFGGYYTGFEDYVTSDLPWHEWRFGGTLGFGGKLHLSPLRMYVGCYPEDCTPENDALIERVNRRLAEMWGS